MRLGKKGRGKVTTQEAATSTDDFEAPPRRWPSNLFNPPFVFDMTPKFPGGRKQSQSCNYLDDVVGKVDRTGDHGYDNQVMTMSVPG